MTRIHFRQLPIVTRIAVCISLFSAWVLFAEFVIDRYGWHQYLPFYRFGDLCPYEIVVVLLILAYWIRAHRYESGDSTRHEVR